MAAVSEMRCRSDRHSVTVEPHGPPPELVILAVNAAGEPLALECPGCRTHHTLDGQPVGRAADIVHLTSAGEFAQAARRLIATERLNVDGED